MTKLLELKSVSEIYQTISSETLSISNISFKVDEGEFVSLLGPSGCGKTTILSIIAGLLKPTSGEVVLDGKQVTKSGTNIGYMFQRDNLFEWLSVEKNIMLGPNINHSKNCLSPEKIKKLIKTYGLAGFEKSKPNELSGGMRQRASLIRTLALDPKLLLLDEPFSALDYQTRLSVQNDVHKIIKSEGKTAMLVTHDISEALAMSDKIIMLSHRPGQVKRIICLNFDKSLSPLERRSDKKFNEYFEMLWRDLQ